VITEGQSPVGLYLVQHGELSVNKRHNNQIHEVGTISANSVFGEVSIALDAPASAEVRTTQPCSLIKIPVEQIQKLLEGNAGFRKSLVHLAEQRSAASALAVNPIFSKVPQTLREILFLNAKYQSLAPDEVLFSQGDTDTELMYLIVSGKAETSIQKSDQKEKISILERCIAGDILGCSAFITDEKRAVTVIAITELHLMPIDSNAPGVWSRRFDDFKEASATESHRKQELLKNEN